jgi:phytoene dehydrogenase-like protein
VTVLEEQDTIGGGARSAELTLPGFLHDVCSAVHPLAIASPFFRQLALDIEWIHPPAPLAHPLDDGRVVLLERSVEATCRRLGGDASRYLRWMQPLALAWEDLLPQILAPLNLPQHPLAMARFGVQALRSACGLADYLFHEAPARALLAGIAAHSMLPLGKPASAAAALLLGIAGHASGWPIPRGGSQRIADALVSVLESLGGRIVTGTPVMSLPNAPIVMCDVTPRQLADMAPFPATFRRSLLQYRYGMGAYKLDWALDGPIPWRSRECAWAGTVHLGGTLEEIAESERLAWSGGHADRPFVLLAQPSLFDPTRAPQGKHTVWAYCHVPHGSTFDMTERIEQQVERFAPGFRDRILARSVLPPAALERHNANLVGGDIGGGAMDLRQIFARPTPRLYSTPLRGVYICSSSTPPGGGVHGMCGYHAARRALRELQL